MLDEVQKPLSPSQRRKKALVFKKSLHKRLKTMQRNAGRMPPKEILMKRAATKAKLAVIKKKKLLSPELLVLYPSQLTIPQKVALEKKLSKYRSLIAKITPKLFKVVLKQQKDKIKQQNVGEVEWD